MEFPHLKSVSFYEQSVDSVCMCTRTTEARFPNKYRLFEYGKKNRDYMFWKLVTKLSEKKKWNKERQIFTAFILQQTFKLTQI